MCIDWLPDGRLLIVSASDGLLLRREPDGSLVTHADLTGLADHKWNDIVVDGRGNAYIGNVGFDFQGGEFAPGTLALVTPDGSARQVADGVAFPNGMVVTPDNSTLILAESYGNRLTAFDLAADGSLSNRRLWADLQGGAPDGICLDAENAIWYGDVPNKRCVRVREGGEELQAIDLDRGCFACMLGSANKRTLFLMANEWRGPANMADGPRTGQVLTADAPAPGVGWPSVGHRKPEIRALTSLPRRTPSRAHLLSTSRTGNSSAENLGVPGVTSQPPRTPGFLSLVELKPLR